MTGWWRPLHGGRGLELVALVGGDTNRPNRGILARLVGFLRRRRAEPQGVTRDELLDLIRGDPEIEVWDADRIRLELEVVERRKERLTG